MQTLLSHKGFPGYYTGQQAGHKSTSVSHELSSGSSATEMDTAELEAMEAEEAEEAEDMEAEEEECEEADEDDDEMDGDVAEIIYAGQDDG